MSCPSSSISRSFNIAVFRLRTVVFLLFGGLLCLTAGELFPGADGVVLFACSMWSLVTRVHTPPPTSEALFASACAAGGLPDLHLAIASGFTFGLCQIGLHGNRGIPGTVLFAGVLTFFADQAGAASVLLTTGSGVLLGAGVIGVASVAFGRQRSLRASIRRLSVRADRLAQYLPDLLVERLGYEPAAPCVLERVWLVAVFVDVEGFTERSAQLTLESIEALVQEFVISITRAARAERGVVMKLLGDGALVVFPAEDASGRNRAVSAAMRFARQAVRMPVGEGAHSTEQRALRSCSLRAGIASGVCALGEWGASDVLDYSVIGLPVNLAARLQGAAPSGGLLIDLCTANLMESPTGPVTSLWLDGLGPVRAVRVAAG